MTAQSQDQDAMMLWTGDPVEYVYTARCEVREINRIEQIRVRCFHHDDGDYFVIYTSEPLTPMTRLSLAIDAHRQRTTCPCAENLMARLRITPVAAPADTPAG